MTRRRTSVTAAGMAAAALTFALTTPASADLTTSCVGEGGAVTVPGDLVVPRGETCVLDGTTVTGDVIVRPDADLIGEGITVTGRVRVSPNAYFEGVDSELGERVALVRSFGAVLDGSSVTDRVIVRGGDSEYPAFVEAIDTDLGEDLRAIGGEIYLDGSDVSGSVITREALYTDLYDTFVDGTLRVIDNELGSVACGVAIQGDARYVGTMDAVQLGGDSPLVTCDSGSYWGGDVRVANTMGGVGIDNNIVNGDLTLSGNDPVAVLGDGNMVRGNVNGDFTLGSDDDDDDSDAISPAALDSTMLRAFVADEGNVAAKDVATSVKAPEVAPRVERKERVEERREDAIDAAEEAGQAF